MIQGIGNERWTEGRLHIFAAGERAELPIVPKPVPSISAVRLLITFSNSGRNGAMLTERFDEAFRYAHRLHRDQTRKGTPIPYISHLMTVAALVVEHGGNEDQAIAGFLHDAAADQGGAATPAELRTTLRAALASISSVCPARATARHCPCPARPDP